MEQEATHTIKRPIDDSNGQWQSRIEAALIDLLYKRANIGLAGTAFNAAILVCPIGSTAHQAFIAFVITGMVAWHRGHLFRQNGGVSGIQHSCLDPHRLSFSVDRRYAAHGHGGDDPAVRGFGLPHGTPQP
jgi:hypothetical protein